MEAKLQTLTEHYLTYALDASEAHPDSYSTGTNSFFSGGKAAGA